MQTPLLTESLQERLLNDGYGWWLREATTNGVDSRRERRAKRIYNAVFDSLTAGLYDEKAVERLVRCLEKAERVRRHRIATMRAQLKRLAAAATDGG